MDIGSDLDFAYKYPFSSIAKQVVLEHAGTNSSISLKYLDKAVGQIETAINSGLEYREIRMSSSKIDYLMAYLYSRMILSAIKDIRIIRAYANAEAARAVDAAYESNDQELIVLSKELGLEITPRFGQGAAADYEEFAIRFEEYLKNAPVRKEFELVNQRLSGGTVIMDRDRIKGFLKAAAAREILKGLPIKSTDLPREIIDYCKNLKLNIKEREIKTKRVTAGSEQWIEKLLKTPIADVRHRTVNLILAPYMVNVRGFSVEEATKIITEYIERCKEVDPNTKVTSKYIEYQCDYAKKKGMKPLSFDKARELLQGAIDIEKMR